jgi:hypothetical protein
VTAPEVGRKVRALTTTRSEQQVVVEVTAIERETPEGTYVWGHRQYGRGNMRRTSRPRQTAIPNLYLVPAQED